MERAFRLTRSTEFYRVKKQGKAFAHPLLVLIALSNASPSIRVAVSASRSVGGSVQRNRAKRRIRACMDSLMRDVRPGWDMIVLARQPILNATSVELSNALEAQLKKAGVLG